jgi:hypothetical protein
MPLWNSAASGRRAARSGTRLGGGGNPKKLDLRALGYIGPLTGCQDT